MPDEINPGYVACKECGRVVETDHVNTRGNCAECSPPRESSKDEDED